LISRVSALQPYARRKPMLERFTEHARQVVVLAQEEARMLQHGCIGTEHLLLGLLSGEEEQIAAQVLADLDITAERVREEIVRTSGRGENAAGQMPLTPHARDALARALREALSLGRNHIGTEHILLGLLHEDEGAAGRILSGFGADGGELRGRVVRALSNRGSPWNDIKRLSDATLDELIEELLDEEREVSLLDHELDLAVPRAERERHLRR